LGVSGLTCPKPLASSSKTVTMYHPTSRALLSVYSGMAWIKRRLAGVSEDSYEVQLLKLLRDVMLHGTMQANRTGVDAMTLSGAALRFDASKGFPAVTTKRLPIKSVVGELCAMLRGITSAAGFREFGCKVWDQNANENKDWLSNPYRKGTDDLGPIYGAQWRSWQAFKDLDLGEPTAGDAHVRENPKLAAALKHGYVVVSNYVSADGHDHVVLNKAVDQLRQCVETIANNPTDRRILFHGWNPATLEEQALPVCHLLYQFLPNVERRELSLCLYLRSNDLGLGNPYNAAEATALLELVARLTGYTAKWVTLFIADAHVYSSHFSMVTQMLRRTPKKAPRLRISDRIPKFTETGALDVTWLDNALPSDFTLEGYEHHDPISAPMAV